MLYLCKEMEDYKACMTHHFVIYRKRNGQVKRLQSGGRTFKRKTEICNDAEIMKPQ